MGGLVGVGGWTMGNADLYTACQSSEVFIIFERLSFSADSAKVSFVNFT